MNWVDMGRPRNKYMHISRLTSKKIILNGIYKIVRDIIIVGICFMILYPFLIKFIVAFMSQTDLYDPTVRYLPRHWSIQNILFVLNTIDWKNTVPPTFLLCMLVSVLTVISCTLIGYGFGRFNFPGSKLLFSIVIFTLIVPPQTIMLTTFDRFKNFDIFGLYQAFTGNQPNLLNSFAPFLLMSGLGIGFRNGLYIFLLRQYFRGVPNVLEEAASIDGASTWRIFYQIILPGAVPMMITVAMFSFAWQWTDNFYTTLLAPQSNFIADVIPSITAYADPIMTSMAKNTSSFLLVVPLVLLYLVSQKFLVEGIERSGIVG